MLLKETESVSNTISQGWDQELLLFRSKVTAVDINRFCQRGGKRHAHVVLSWSIVTLLRNTISQGWELLLFQSKVGNSCRYKQILYLSNLCCATSSIDCPSDAFLETKCPDLLLEISFVQIVFRISLTDR